MWDLSFWLCMLAEHSVLASLLSTFPEIHHLALGTVLFVLPLCCLCNGAVVVGSKGLTNSLAFAMYLVGVGNFILNCASSAFPMIAAVAKLGLDVYLLQVHRANLSHGGANIIYARVLRGITGSLMLPMVWFSYRLDFRKS